MGSYEKDKIKTTYYLYFWVKLIQQYKLSFQTVELKGKVSRDSEGVLTILLHSQEHHVLKF
jgi:hypothetical protein